MRILTEMYYEYKDGALKNDRFFDCQFNRGNFENMGVAEIDFYRSYAAKTYEVLMDCSDADSLIRKYLKSVYVCVGDTSFGLFLKIGTLELSIELPHDISTFDEFMKSSNYIVSRLLSNNEVHWLLETDKKLIFGNPTIRLMYSSHSVVKTEPNMMLISFDCHGSILIPVKPHNNSSIVAILANSFIRTNINIRYKNWSIDYDDNRFYINHGNFFIENFLYQNQADFEKRIAKWRYDIPDERPIRTSLDKSIDFILENFNEVESVKKVGNTTHLVFNKDTYIIHENGEVFKKIRDKESRGR